MCVDVKFSLEKMCGKYYDPLWAPKPRFFAESPLPRNLQNYRSSPYNPTTTTQFPVIEFPVTMPTSRFLWWYPACSFWRFSPLKPPNTPTDFVPWACDSWWTPGEASPCPKPPRRSWLLFWLVFYWINVVFITVFYKVHSIKLAIGDSENVIIPFLLKENLRKLSAIWVEDQPYSACWINYEHIPRDFRFSGEISCIFWFLDAYGRSYDLETRKIPSGIWVLFPKSTDRL